jgi:hypothetical protein
MTTPAASQRRLGEASERVRALLAAAADAESAQRSELVRAAG